MEENKVNPETGKSKDVKFNFDLQGRVQRLLSYFDFDVTVDQNNSKYINLKSVTDRFKQARTGDNEKKLKSIFSQDSYIPPIQRLLEKWSTQVNVNYNSWQNRKELIEDLDQMYFNSPIVSKAVILSRDETLQADSNFRVIGVEAKDRRQEDFLYRFIEDTKIESLLRDTIYNIILYGDAGWVPAITDKGYESFHPVDILDIQDIFEFRGSDILNYENTSRNNYDYKSINTLLQVDKIKALVQSIEENHNVSDLFKVYNLGYRVSNIVLPPWSFVHFRNYSTRSPFKPFGMPMLLHCMAPYRAREMAMSLQIAARGSKFPIMRFKIKLPNTSMMPTDQLEAVTEFINELDNSGMYSVRKETVGIGERVFTIEELFEVDILKNEIDLADIADIEMLRNDEIDSTQVPRSVFDPTAGTLPVSGVSFIQQSRPFGRFIYGIQSVILDTLTNVCKLHMLLSNKFSLDEIDFMLTMPYPEAQTDKEIISSQSDLLTLSGTILDTLAQRLLGDSSAPLPVDLVRNVFTQILPYDKSRVDDWIQMIQSSRQVKKPGEEGEEDEMAESIKKYKKIPSSLLKEEIYEVTKSAKLNSLSEASVGGKHYKSSRVSGSMNNFDPKYLEYVKLNTFNSILKG
jgi:hypothetical protein